jgi:hypothetical protein
MSRRTFVYDRQQDKMVEVTREADPFAIHYAHGDIPAFRSPVDGSMVEGRRQYEEHMKKHCVVPFEAGSEKVTPPQPDPRPRRELLWELVDRSIQRKGDCRG